MSPSLESSTARGEGRSRKIIELKNKHDVPSFSTPPEIKGSFNASEPSTPTPAPAGSHTSISSSKKVLFCDPPTQETPKPRSMAQNPLKSILRQSVSIIHTSPKKTFKIDPNTILSDIYSCSIDFSKYLNLDEVFEVAVNALQKNIRGKHLEIYAALMALLRAKDRSVSTESLIKHGNQLLSFAHRDLLMAESSSNKLDIRIVIQILKVVDYLFYCEDVAATLNQDVVTKFLYKGLTALENSDSAKSIIGAYLHIFNYQRVPKPLGNEVATRLLLAVSSRPTLSSVGLLSEYVSTLRLLIQSHPSIVASQCSSWLPLALRSLIDGSSLVRQQALMLLQECNHKLLPDFTISNCIRQTFNDNIDDDGPVMANQSDIESVSPVLHQNIEKPVTDKGKCLFIDLFISRLSSLLMIQGEGKTVMTIWSSILLSLSKWGPEPNERAEKWEYFGQMLSLSKLAFNCEVSSSKLAAIQSWKVVINICTQDQKVDLSDRKAAFLLHPLLSLLPDNRPVVVKHVTATYVHLLNSYFQVVSQSNMESLSFIWRAIVTPYLTAYVKLVTNAREKGTEILIQLLSPGSSFKGSPAVKEKSGSEVAGVDISALQPFPPKFFKTHISTVLDVLVTYFEQSWTDAIRIWETLLNSIRASMKREIHISRETMTQIAALTSFIADLPEHNISSQRVAMFVMSLIYKLGILPFLDQELSVVHGQLSIGTPIKQKSFNSNEDVSSLPLMHLSRGILRAPSNADDPSYGSIFKDILGMFLEKAGPPKRIMSLFACFLSLIPSGNKDALLECYLVIGNILRRQVLTWDFTALETEFIAILTQSFQEPIVTKHLDDWIELSGLMVKSNDQFGLLISALLQTNPDPTLLSNYVCSLTNREFHSCGKNILESNIVPIAHVVKVVSINLRSLGNGPQFVESMLSMLTSDLIHPRAKAVISHPLREMAGRFLQDPSADFFDGIKSMVPQLYLYLTSSMEEDSQLLLISCSDLIAGGLLSEDPEVYELTRNQWHSFCDKGIKGPYPRSLVNAVNRARTNSGSGLNRIRYPKDFPLTSARGRSTRSGSSVIETTPSVDKIIYESVQGPITEGDTSSTENPTINFGTAPGTPPRLDRRRDQLTSPSTAAQERRKQSARSVSPSVTERMEDTLDDSVQNSLPDTVLSSINDKTLVDSMEIDSDIPSSPPETSRSSLAELASHSPVNDSLEIRRPKNNDPSSSSPLKFGSSLYNTLLKSPTKAPSSSEVDDSSNDGDSMNKKRKRKAKKTNSTLSAKKKARPDISEPSQVITSVVGTKESEPPCPSTPVKRISSYQTPLTPEFSSPPHVQVSAGRFLFSMLKKFETEFQTGDAFADLTPQEKFETETLLMGVMVKARCSQMASMPNAMYEE